MTEKIPAYAKIIAAIVVLIVGGGLVLLVGKYWAAGILGALAILHAVRYRLKRGEWEKQIND